MDTPSPRCHFADQHENEVIHEVIHRHWFNILSKFVGIIGITFLLAGSVVVLPLLFPGFSGSAADRFTTFVQNTALLISWLFGFFLWIDYYFDVWIVTNERIVNVEQKGLFDRQVSELRFNRVQDVTSTVEGLIPTMLNYGDVAVQTAGETERFLFRQVPDPNRIKDLVMRLSEGASGDGTRPTDAPSAPAPVQA